MKTERPSMELPQTGFAGLMQNWKSDMLSGFLVFLIALPLCLGIAMASGFPPIAGIITAIVGGILVTFFSGSYVTVKGPAAGLIVIAIGAVTDLGAEFGGEDKFIGYKLALATIVVSGIIQILFGFLKTGVLGDFFPSSAVHGMLASIGIIIGAKQIHTLLGVKPEANEPIGLIAEIPYSIMHMNPEIAVIGIVSIVILFTLPLIKNKYVKMIPAPMVVILFAIPLGHYFDLEHTHKYLVNGHEFEVGPTFLITLPSTVFEGITFPDFSHVFSGTSLRYIIMFSLVGSIESLLSTKAIDVLDPYKRKANLNKDLLGVGIGNTICGFIGGLPMISEIVRSFANINNGAKSMWSNFFHGVFMLLFVALAPGMLHQIPLAALAAMLIFTGYRLASPKVFTETFKVGKEQLIVFLTTIVITLATDILVGIFSGILVKFLLHVISGAPLKSIFRSHVSVAKSGDREYTLIVSDAVIFSNYLGFKRILDRIPSGSKITLDFSGAKMVDHTVMEHLHHYGEDYHRNGGETVIKGMDRLKPLSAHPLSVRMASDVVSVKHTGHSRESEMRGLAKRLNFSYKGVTPNERSNFGRFSTSNRWMKYEGNILVGNIEGMKYRISDISVVEGGDMKAHITQLTVISICNFTDSMPVFTLEKEGIYEKLEGAFGMDIDFNDFPDFSDKYRLKGLSEKEVRAFFNKDLLRFFEQNTFYNVESLINEVVIYKSETLLPVDEILKLLNFSKTFLNTVSKLQLQESK